MCVGRLRQASKFARCVNENSAALADFWGFLRCSLDVKYFMPIRTTWRVRQKFPFGMCALSADVGNKFLSRRVYEFIGAFVSGRNVRAPRVFVRSHYRLIWPWREHYLSHIFILPVWRALFENAYLSFFMSPRLRNHRTRFELNCTDFLASGVSSALPVTLSFIIKFMNPHNEAMINSLVTSFHFHP